MEERQAYLVINEAIRNGVEHFVFTSVDRGGPSVSDKSPTDIPHFASKHRIEEYLKEKSTGTKTQWTYLETGDFYG